MSTVWSGRTLGQRSALKRMQLGHTPQGANLEDAGLIEMSQSQESNIGRISIYEAPRLVRLTETGLRAAVPGAEGRGRMGSGHSVGAGFQSGR